jgi:hypothetical protein
MALESSPIVASSPAPAPVATNLADQVARSDFRPDQVIRVEKFDSSSERDWCELMRDILALANSGGGRILVGTAIDERDVLARLAHCTDSGFGDLRILPANEFDGSVTVLAVGRAVFPVRFSQQAEGTNSDASAMPSIAPGFYFRHGERTEPGTTADMRVFVERLLRRVRRRWLRGIRRVLTKPITFDEDAAPKHRAAKRIRIERTVLQPVRIVSDPNAPALQPQDVDRLYPWRQKDLLGELNHRIGRRLLTTYDVQAVRRYHLLDERPEFVFHLPGAGRRYSPAVAEWIFEQFSRDPEFFHEARAADQQMLKLRRKKPR